MKKSLLFLISITIINLSCSKPSPPEESLKAFINYRFSNNQTREGILKMLTASLYDSINDIDAESFKKNYLSKKYEIKSFKINISNCVNDTKCFLTYTLKYYELKNNDKIRKFEIKKIAELISIENQKWKISDINNIKSVEINLKDIDISGRSKL